MSSTATKFVHLHLHSEYSLLDGAIRFDQLASFLHENGMDTVAVTDHGVLYGAMQFFEKMKKHDIKPILGMEAYIAPSMREKKPKQPRYHLNLLVRNEVGYKNLSKLSSLGFIDGFYYKPRIDRELLSQYCEGLLIGSACLSGEVASHLLSGRPDKAEEAVRFYQDLVGKENFFIELMDHGLPDEKKVLPLLVELARSTGAILAATNDAHYLRDKDAKAHEVLLCIQTKRLLSDENRMRFGTEEFFVKTPDEMSKLFHWIPEAVSNTVMLAEKCNFEMTSGDFLLPEFPLPDGADSMGAYLRSLSYSGIEKRFNRKPSEDEKKRLDHELKIIEEMGFPGYFLIVSEIIRWAKDRNIPVGPGRGSAAGSLVSYSIDITDVNPLEYDLSFERFLNPARREMPDIDIDVCSERRGEIIEHIIEKFGRQSVCQLITLNRMKNRSMVRDIMRVMGRPPADGDLVAKLVASAPDPDAPFSVVVSKVHELARMAREDKLIGELVEYCSVLDNLARHSGVHAAGVVIAPGDLLDQVPMCVAKEVLTTQFEKKDTEKTGLLKLDLLGLRNVTVLHHSEQMVRKEEPDFKISEIPLDDAKTIRSIAAGDTTGVFQLESSGMRDALRKINVTTFDDIVAAVAIYRPGSMDMIDLYADNKKGIESGSKDFTITYLHHELEETLAPTHGVIIYQEQVMRIANRLAGMSMADADTLRRAMSRKNPEVMAEMREEFIEGAVSRDVKRNIAAEVFDLIEKFAGYGFNKSHAVCYATIAYHTAYMKVHYPQEYLAACLTSEIGNIAKIPYLIDECNRLHVEIVPPSVNISSAEFSVDSAGRIIYALAAIKNVGEGPAECIVEGRRDGGEFANIFDLCLRVKEGSMNKKVLESLIYAGALDSFTGNRNQHLECIEQAINWSIDEHAHRRAGQMGLFGGESGNMKVTDEPVLPDVPALDLDEKCRMEKELLGFYVSGHPLDRYKDEFSLLTDPIENASSSKRKTILTGGRVVEIKIIPTRNGEMAFALVEGRSGTGEIVIFNDTYVKYRDLLEPGRILVFEGEVSTRRGNSNFSVLRVYPVEKLRKLFRVGIVIFIDGESIDMHALQNAVGVIRSNPGPGSVQIKVKHGSGWVVQASSRSLDIRPEDHVITELREILGYDAVKLIRER